MINIECSANNVFVSGELSISTITREFEKKYQNLFDNKHISDNEINVDLSKVNKIDTAGLAWLLMWIERAVTYKKQLNLVNVPEKLLNLAKLSSVESLLPIVANC